MNTRFLILSCIGIASLLFFSCEGCVQKTAKKITDVSVSAIEGVTESLSEHGEKIGEKTTDALGSLLKGAGKSLERQLNEHAEYVASVTGRTFVQALDGFESGIVTEHYEMIPHEEDFDSGITLQYFGKIKDTDVIDAYFIIPEIGDYDCQFQFVDAKGKNLLTRKATINKKNTQKKISVVSLALNAEEKAKVEKSAQAKIKVSKK